MFFKDASESFLSYCQYVKKLSPHTIRAYKNDLAAFNDFNKCIELNQISKHRIKEYLYNLHNTNLSIRSIKRRVACLKSMFRWLEQEDLIDLNPLLQVNTSLKVPKQLPRNIPKRNLKRMLTTARNALFLTKSDDYSLNTIDTRVSVAKEMNKLTCILTLELLFATGVRVSELVNIELSHIFTKEKKIKVLGKGQRERFVFLPSNELVTLINTYIYLRKKFAYKNQFLLINSRGKQASPHFIRKLIRLTSTKANIDTITPHMYRHSSACQLLESGVDIRYVQKLLGHQSILTTQLYTHVNDNELQRKITKANIRSYIS